MTAVVIALITAGSTIIVAAIYNVAAIRSARRKAIDDAEERHARDRSADAAAQVAANAAMAQVSEQMATATAGYLDRLHAEFADLLQRRAAERVAYEQEIADLRNQVSVLDNEVRQLRRQLAGIESGQQHHEMR